MKSGSERAPAPRREGAEALVSYEHWPIAIPIRRDGLLRESMALKEG